MAHSKRDVEIEGVELPTNRNRAKRFVKSGRAEWIDDSQKAIRFITRYALATISEPCLPHLPWDHCYRTEGAPAIGPWAGGPPEWYATYQ